MALKYNPFQSKLQELDQENRRMEKWLQVCHAGTNEELREVKEILQREFCDDERRMEKLASGSRSPVVSRLASMQLEHYRNNAKALEHASEYFERSGKENESDRAESMALYAEFSLDHAIHAVRYALLTVCSALELQMQVEIVENDKITQEKNDERSKETQ